LFWSEGKRHFLTAVMQPLIWLHFQ